MNFIKAIIKALTNIFTTALDFTVGPFFDLRKAKEGSDEYNVAALSVILRVLFLLGVCLGWGGILIGVATFLLKISMWLTIFCLALETIIFICEGLFGESETSFQYKRSF